MADPTINGCAMRCYNPGRGWSLRVAKYEDLAFALYIEIMPALGKMSFSDHTRNGRTRIWIEADIRGHVTRFPYSELMGLSTSNAAKIGEGLVRGLVNVIAFRPELVP
jgi:hypothetical protein